MNNAYRLNSREIVERIIIHGDLVLDTPVHLGNGEGDGSVDMRLILDPFEGYALLTGASLAGALRNYLREREHGYDQAGDERSLFSALFGWQQDEDGEQSLLIICDSLGEKPKIEIRDGVAIDPVTHTAEDNKKFDFELIEAGSHFPLRFELQVRQDRKDQLLKGLAIALQGLECGEIRLGSRKRRGLGQCIVSEWSVYRYDLSKSRDLILWLNNDKSNEIKGNSIADLLDVGAIDLDQREFFNLEATFTLSGSLLIRSGSGKSDAPDMVHLHSNRNNRQVPILSGTSLVGALRARALRISKTVGTEEQAKIFINRLFGLRIESPEDKPSASRLIANETVVEDIIDLVQSRVKIDRFTGGSFPTALFSEQPVFGKSNTLVKILIDIRQPKDAEIGLMLLLLKDLWTGDLPLGGEISVGRGRLQGVSAQLTLKKVNSVDSKRWIIKQAKESLETSGDINNLENFVKSFIEEIKA
ncbi:MAG: RAMP superfamily CRISPR-associated protein [Methanothrix sp.]|jgi:CRISPR/Cas system CSM-associated protein Csm3 (group 7 of RAMP superfamily)|nr:RAMP superfamily CRISPR-associated protein [Methanothrix sp.]